jgi:hypothetical protein
MRTASNPCSTPCAHDEDVTRRKAIFYSRVFIQKCKSKLYCWRVRTETRAQDLQHANTHPVPPTVKPSIFSVG